jgi:hypothetical protein
MELTDGTNFLKYGVAMASGGMTYIPSFMKIGTDVQEYPGFVSTI